MISSDRLREAFEEGYNIQVARNEKSITKSDPTALGLRYVYDLGWGDGYQSALAELSRLDDDGGPVVSTSRPKPS